MDHIRLKLPELVRILGGIEQDPELLVVNLRIFVEVHRCYESLPLVHVQLGVEILEEQDHHGVQRFEERSRILPHLPVLPVDDKELDSPVRC